MTRCDNCTPNLQLRFYFGVCCLQLHQEFCLALQLEKKRKEKIIALSLVHWSLGALDAQYTNYVIGQVGGDGPSSLQTKA